MSGEQTRPCRYCVAAYELGSQDCRWTHEDTRPEFYALATELARLFQSDPPSDAQVGWFLEDAQAVIDDFDPLPKRWKLEGLDVPPSWRGETARFRLNGKVYVIEDGEGHITPVRLSTLREWEREANA